MWWCIQVILVPLDFKGKQECEVPKWLLTAWRCGFTGARREHQLRSHNVRSLFLVFSVPLRASNHCTNRPGYLIQPNVRRPGNLEENLGPCQQHQRCFQWHLPASFTCMVLQGNHHCKLPTRRLVLEKKKTQKNQPIQFFRGPFRKHFLHELKKKSL